MRFYQTRQFEMLRIVADFLKMNKEMLSSKVPALNEIITDYVESAEYLRKLRQGNHGVVAISASRKKSTKEEFIGILMKVQGMVQAHDHQSKAKARLHKLRPRNEEEVLAPPASEAESAGSVAAGKKQVYSFSDLKNSKADNLCLIGEQIITSAKRIKNIRHYGLTVEDIKDAQAYYNEYAAVKNAPKLRKKEVATRNEDLALGIKEAISLLENTIDPLMRIATEENAKMKGQYKSFRIVLHRGQGRKTEKEERYRKSRKRKKAVAKKSDE